MLYNKDNINDIDWLDVSVNQELSENFMREFQDKVDWGIISAQQNLSEDFIREFQDKVDWDNISINQACDSEEEKKIMSTKGLM
jgi:hypothetical protein